MIYKYYAQVALMYCIMFTMFLFLAPFVLMAFVLRGREPFENIGRVMNDFKRSAWADLQREDHAVKRAKAVIKEFEERIKDK